MILFDSYDDAIIGVATVWRDSSLRDVVVYDGMKIVRKMVTRDKMSFEDALEYVGFNMEGGYLGKTTPIIAWPTSAEEIKLRIKEGNSE